MAQLVLMTPPLAEEHVNHVQPIEGAQIIVTVAAMQMSLKHGWKATGVPLPVGAVSVNR